MKVIILIFGLFAVASAASISKNGPSQEEVDWAFIEDVILQMQFLVRTVMMAIFNHANDDDPLVGADIGQRVSAASIDAVELLNLVLLQIEEKTLTLQAAETDMNRLQAIIALLYIGIEADLAKLSETARNLINADFNFYYDSVYDYTNQIYNALRPITPETEPTIGPTTQLPETTTQFPLECPPTGVVQLPYPGNCAMYRYCIEGAETLYRCPEGMLFDTQERLCKDKDEAVCTVRGF